MPNFCLFFGSAGINGTQEYRIVSGNTGNAFRLESHRKQDNILYHDLQVRKMIAIGRIMSSE